MIDFAAPGAHARGDQEIAASEGPVERSNDS